MRQKIRERHSGDVVALIKKYIETCVEEEYLLDGLAWYDIMTVFFQLRMLNIMHSDIPMIQMEAHKRRDPAPWDYPHRATIVWIHLLAANYGWSLTDIQNLWPEEVAMFVQEILTEEQLRREWDHSLSPVAHPRDKKGKDLFQPLTRPAWMTRKPRKQKLLRAGLPKGTIIDLSGVSPEDLDG